MTNGTAEIWTVRALVATVLLLMAGGCVLTTGGRIDSDTIPSAVPSTLPSSVPSSVPSSLPAPPSATTGAPAGPTTSPPPSGPDQPFYVDPSAPAVRQEIAWRAEGRTEDADQIAKISREPQGIWLTSDPGRVERQARAVARGAAAASRTPIVVLYDLPHRDCDGYSSGGAPNAAAYRDWLARVVRGLGGSAPVVILEPDGVALALAGCLSDGERTERYGLLADAVTQLVRRDDAQVYVDAGNPGWVQDPAAVAAALRASGVDNAAGFSLNVSNFYTTAANDEYGHRIANALGGAHFVIDTSRNGNGPDTSGGQNWCNPPGRALGSRPTVATGDPSVDAFLWVKDPGESDGACRPGAPAAGDWWPQYALDLATASN